MRASLFELQALLINWIPFSELLHRLYRLYRISTEAVYSECVSLCVMQLILMTCCTKKNQMFNQMFVFSLCVHHLKNH